MTDLITLSSVYEKNFDLTIRIELKTTVVLEKFTVAYFRVKIVCGKIFSSLGVSDENFNNELFLRSNFLFHFS